MIRVLQLQDVKTRAEAESLWKSTIADPKALTKEVRGQICLHRFSGVRVLQEHNHSILAGLRQRMDVKSADDLKQFEKEAKGKVSRAEWRMDSEKQEILENRGHDFSTFFIPQRCRGHFLGFSCVGAN